MTSTFPPLVFDGHNDTLLHLYSQERGGGRSFFEEGERGHLDLPRARRGGFGGGFFAVYVPPDPAVPRLPQDGLELSEGGYAMPLPPPLDDTYARRVAEAMTANLFRLERESGGQLCVVRSAEQLEGCLRDGVLAAVLHYEGAEGFGADVDALEVLYAAGLRSLGIVWSRANAAATGVPFRFPRSPDTGDGLTAVGMELVRACNRLGVLLDLAHLNERGFWDVAALTEAPLVVTHAGVHALCPLTRNLTDRQLDAIRESDGMVGVVFAVSMLWPDGGRDKDTPLEVLVRHVDYLVERIGIDRVGFGSDFDGAEIPDEIGDAAGLPHLLDALRRAGYDDASLRKLAHENWLRVLRQTWR